MGTVNYFSQKITAYLSRQSRKVFVIFG